jgi:hypothetical protein
MLASLHMGTIEEETGLHAMTQERCPRDRGEESWCDVSEFPETMSIVF